jgi:hypothetical protein
MEAKYGPRRDACRFFITVLLLTYWICLSAAGACTVCAMPPPSAGKCHIVETVFLSGRLNLGQTLKFLGAADIFIIPCGVSDLAMVSAFVRA